MTYCVGHAWPQSAYERRNEVGNFENEWGSSSLKAMNVANRSYFNRDLIIVWQLNKLVHTYILVQGGYGWFDFEVTYLINY